MQSSIKMNIDLIKKHDSDPSGKIITAYKVVRSQFHYQNNYNKRDVFKSARIDAYKFGEKWSLDYQVDKWTYPKVKYSKILVFQDRKSATKFCDKYDHEYIYECQVLNPKRSGPLSRFGHQFDTIWKQYKRKQKYTHLQYRNVPTGTLWCDAVKLTRQIVLTR